MGVPSKTVGKWIPDDNTGEFKAVMKGVGPLSFLNRGLRIAFLSIKRCQLYDIVYGACL